VVRGGLSAIPTTCHHIPIISARANELTRFRLDITYAYYDIMDTSGAGTRYGIIVIALNRARYRTR